MKILTYIYAILICIIISIIIIPIIIGALPILIIAELFCFIYEWATNDEYYHCLWPCFVLNCFKLIANTFNKLTKIFQ